MKKILVLILMLLPVAAHAQIVGALPFQLQNGTTADATQVMADFNKILNDVNINAAKNGVNNDITALNALVTPITPAQGGSTVYFASTSGGSANAQTVATPSPVGFTLSVGKRVTFIAGFTNTGAMTLNVNSTGATAVMRQTPGGIVALTGDEVVTGNTVEAIFDGTQFILVNSVATVGPGPLRTLASATTTDLGTISTHNVSVTGTTTITSFGSTANTIYPVYQLKFTGALLLTYNATSMILPSVANITTAANDTATALYLGSGNWQVTSYTRANGQPLSFAGNFLQGYIDGLTMSTGGTSTFATDPGEATDSTSSIVMLLGSATSKTTASWAVGSGNGGLDTGSIAANTWYHVYLIRRPDTGVVDITFSLSAASPTLPANYTTWRRIGSIFTNGSSTWNVFTQTGNDFIWTTAFADVTAAATTTSRANTGLSTPNGIVTKALIRVSLTASGAGSTQSLVMAIREADAAPGTTNTNIAAPTSAVVAGEMQVYTNTGGQIALRSSNTTGTMSIRTYGWIDTRGKL